MAVTSFPNGPILVSGAPTMGVGGLPFFTGKYIFADMVNGADGNTGTAKSPVKTIAAAYALTQDGRGDVVVLVGNGASTGYFTVSTTLVWAKNNTHLVGLAAPTVGQMVRITNASTVTANLNPIVSVTGAGCIFQNFSVTQTVNQASTDDQLWNETGTKNYYYGIHFAGMSTAVGAGRAGSYVLSLAGATDLTFENCIIGVSSVARTAANSDVKIRTASARNRFKNCYFNLFATSATVLVVDANAAASLADYVWFDNCKINSALQNASATALTAVAAFNASQGGTIVFDNCSVVGATNYAASTTATVQVLGAAPNGHTSGLAVSSSTT